MSNFTTFLRMFVGIKAIFCFLALTGMLAWQGALAARQAIVVVDKAVVYSTANLEAPIGYISKGKRVMLGEVPANRAQAFPVLIAGKLAYLKARDISFDLNDDQNFVATRFYELTKESYHTHYSLGFINYSSQYNSVVTEQDESFNWYGYQLKGDAVFDNRWGVHIFTTGMWGTKGEEQFRSIELGVGGSYMVIEFKKLRVNFFAQFIGIPFANYSVGSKFRVNGGGYGAGVGLVATYDVSKRWGVEGSVGVYQTRLMGFDTPEEYESPNPTFSGARTVLSGYYRF